MAVELAVELAVVVAVAVAVAAAVADIGNGDVATDAGDYCHSDDKRHEGAAVIATVKGIGDGDSGGRGHLAAEGKATAATAAAVTQRPQRSRSSGRNAATDAGGSGHGDR